MYETPTSEELRGFMQDNNLTGADIEALTGVAPRTARQWVEPSTLKSTSSIPWAAWTLINILLGKLDKKAILESIDRWKTEKTGRGLFKRSNAGRPPKRRNNQER